MALQVFPVVAPQATTSAPVLQSRQALTSDGPPGRREGAAHDRV